jgi:hypothetical protein
LDSLMFRCCAYWDALIFTNLTIKNVEVYKPRRSHCMGQAH